MRDPLQDPDRGRSPGEVPDTAPPGPSAVPTGPDVTGGLDTDRDGRADTLVGGDGVDLILSTDLDGDGFADQILRIGPDGVVRESAPPGFPPQVGAVDGMFDGDGSGY